MNTSPLKVAVVTGAGSGVGRAVALELLGTGYAVVLAGRRADALEKTRTAAGGDATRALVVPTDVTSEQEVRRLFDTAQREYGRGDVLFNNAGRGGTPVRGDEFSVQAGGDRVDVNRSGMLLRS